MPDDLLDRFRHKDRRALSRLLSRLARGEDLGPDAALPTPERPSRVVAITGSGGAGKSTLVGKLIEHIRRENLTVAVLACDPQSPLSGGALLGDRFRMPARPDDDGVFIRSLAAESGRGAVADHLDRIIALLEGFGFDVILVETVGAGQGDVTVRGLADVVVLLLQPETGDDLQWEKAGVLEVADVVVVHKADLPGAEHVEAQVRATLGLSGGPERPVLRVSSKSGQGVAELWAAVAGRPLRRTAAAPHKADLLRLLQQQLTDWLARAEAERPAEWQDLLERWRQRKIPPDRLAGLALRHLLARYGEGLPAEPRAPGSPP